LWWVLNENMVFRDEIKCKVIETAEADILSTLMRSESVDAPSKSGKSRFFNLSSEFFQSILYSMN
jgi:hypothetical protein